MSDHKYKLTFFYTSFTFFCQTSLNSTTIWQLSSDTSSTSFSEAQAFVYSKMSYRLTFSVTMQGGSGYIALDDFSFTTGYCNGDFSFLKHTQQIQLQYSCIDSMNITENTDISLELSCFKLYWSTDLNKSQSCLICANLLQFCSNLIQSCLTTLSMIFQLLHLKHN